MIKKVVASITADVGSPDALESASEEASKLIVAAQSASEEASKLIEKIEATKQVSGAAEALLQQKSQAMAGLLGISSRSTLQAEESHLVEIERENVALEVEVVLLAEKIAVLEVGVGEKQRERALRRKGRDSINPKSEFAEGLEFFNSSDGRRTSVGSVWEGRGAELAELGRIESESGDLKRQVEEIEEKGKMIQQMKVGGGDEMEKLLMWLGINVVSGMAEKLGYPTQREIADLSSREWPKEIKRMRKEIVQKQTEVEALRKAWWRRRESIAIEK